MNLNTNRQEFHKQTSTTEQRNRRKIAREVAAIWDDIARAAGFEPIERRTAWAIAVRINESNQPDTPRWVTLAAIGQGLSSRTEDPESLKRTARNRVGQLFNHAIPRTGAQILTRYKAEEGEDKPHGFVDHLTPVAAFFSELLAEEIKAIGGRKLDKDSRIAAGREARERLISEALAYLPRCEAEIVAPTGEVYARVSAPEAQAYCAKNPGYSAKSYQYIPPAQEEAPRKPLCGADFERLKDRAVRQVVDQILDEIAERNSFEEARLFWRAELWPALQKAGSSWVKVEGSSGRETEVDREEGINYGGNFDAPPSPEPADFEKRGAENFSAPTHDNLAEINYLQEPFFETVENLTYETAVEDDKPVNFDSALDAALFYAADGWHVLPICNYSPATGRCTAAGHPEACTGKKPLVKGNKGKPGEGYTAATRDEGQIRRWWGGAFKDAGVGIRLDGHILIDCDLKDGGPESYEFLRDTFDLPPTLTAITQSGGCHYVFKKPEDLPPDWLKSWTRVTDKIALPGIDLKVGVCGLLYAEPTIGSKGVYRWIDPTAELATLPRDACDFLHEIRFKDEQPKAEKARAARVYSSSGQSGAFDPNQSKYFRDVRPGESRHRRLFNIACSIRANTRASADQIAAALRYHAERFSEPLQDEAYILRTSAAIAGCF